MATTNSRSRAVSAPAKGKSAKGGHPSLAVPVVTPQFKMRRVQVPTFGMPAVTGHDVAEAGRAVSSYLPPPRRLGYYAGLGALAAFGLIDWPVAAAIGVGVAVARRSGGDRPLARPASGTASRSGGRAKSGG